jgi:hypothetical protein
MAIMIFEAPVWVNGMVWSSEIMVVIFYPRRLSAMDLTSLAASVFGNRISIDVWLRMVSLTLLSRLITPANGGENFRNPWHAFKIVL